MGGTKHDTKKCRMDLIPSEAEIAEAWVWTFGAKKYGDRNWQEGINYSRLVAAMQRHLTAIKRGELIDPESGLPHAACIRCSAGMLLYFEANAELKVDVNNLNADIVKKALNGQAKLPTKSKLNDLPENPLTRPSWADTVMKDSQDENMELDNKSQT